MIERGNHYRRLKMRKTRNTHQLWIGALTCALFLMTGCGSDNTPTAPGIQPEIVNNPDSFSFQVTAVQNYSGTLNYAWTNTGPMADIDHSCALTGGSATLVLIDDTGAEVYSNDLSQGGSFVSSSGNSGNWTVRVVLVGASGDLNFRTDMRPAP